MKPQNKNPLLHSTYNILHSPRGFTLVEIVIVVGVLLVMSSLLMIYTRKGGKQIALYRDHATLNQQLLRARGFSMGKFREDELVCGYGVSIMSGGKSYVVFKDLPANGTSCPGNSAYEIDEKIDEFSTDPEVSIVGYIASDIVFRPGLSGVYFDSVLALPGDDARISLELEGSRQRMTLVINHLGQMFTE